MKTDKFEDIIRKKLESIEPDFQEKDWVNFKSYSNGLRNPFFKNLFTNTASKVAASIMFASILALAGNQYFVNKTLENKIAKLEKVIKNGNFNTNDDTNQSEIGNKDPALKNGNEIKINANGSDLAETIEKEDIKTTLKEFEKITTTKFSENNKLATKGLNKSYLANKNEIYFNENFSEKAKKSSKFVSKNNKSGSITENIVFDNINTNEQNNYTKADFNDRLTNNGYTNLHYLTSKSIIIDSTKRAIKVLNKKDFAYFKPENIVTQKRLFSLADAYLRTGMASSLSKNKFSIGANVELFLDQRISITAGLKTTNIYEKFIDERQFKEITKKDFKEKYGIPNPHIHKIRSIEEKTSLLSVPIRINYNHPLVGLNLIVSAGTDLTLKAKKTIDFDDDKNGVFSLNTNPIYNEIEKNTLSKPLENKLFNNLVFAIGAEKRFDKIGIQAKIFDIIKVKDMNYTMAKNNFGGELGVFYKL